MPSPTEPGTSIVPRGGALSWGGVTGRAPAPATAPQVTAAGNVTTTGRVLRAGELRATTKAEEIAATYGLDAGDAYQARGIDQIQGIDRLADAWAHHKATRVERPDFHTPKEALNTVGADLHNVGSLIGNILFGD